MYCFVSLSYSGCLVLDGKRSNVTSDRRTDQHTFKKVAFNYERKYLERPGKSVCIWDRGSEKGPTAYQAAPNVRRERGRGRKIERGGGGGGGGFNHAELV